MIDNAATAKTSPTQSNQSAEKLLALLEVMSTLDEPARLQDLSASLGMNASTVLRFLNPLLQRGYVAQEPESNRYQLTYKLCGLANNIASRTGIRNIAFPYLRNVSHIFQESANLSIERDMALVYVEVINYPGKSLTMMQRIGHVAPLHCTGSGKILLAEYTPQMLEQYVKVKGMQGFTSHTITDLDDLKAALDGIRDLGYAFDNEECEDGARCIAAPVRDYTGNVVAGISVSGPVTRMTDEHIYTNLPYLMDAARQISFRMGWKPAGEPERVRA